MARLGSFSDEFGFGSVGELHLTVTSGRVEYAFPLDRVHEIRRFTTTTPAAGAPPWVKGDLTLDDGTTFPVVDLLARLDVGRTEFTPYTVVVVLDLGANRVGLAVDAAGEVVNLDEGDVQPLPTFGADPSRCFVKGLGRADDRVLSILDLDVVFQDEVATTRRHSDDSQFTAF
jgi:purine-binding chemotaxis protein CheW